MYLSIIMVDKDVTGLVILEIGDLQAIGMPSLLWLECDVDSVNFNNYFWFFGLKGKKRIQYTHLFSKLSFYFTEHNFLLFVESQQCIQDIT